MIHCFAPDKVGFGILIWQGLMWTNFSCMLSGFILKFWQSHFGRKLFDTAVFMFMEFSLRHAFYIYFSGMQNLKNCNQKSNKNWRNLEFGSEFTCFEFLIIYKWKGKVWNVLKSLSFCTFVIFVHFLSFYVIFCKHV